jgi:hypothetical protein
MLNSTVSGRNYHGYWIPVIYSSFPKRTADATKLNLIGLIQSKNEALNLIRSLNDVPFLGSLLI